MCLARIRNTFIRHAVVVWPTAGVKVAEDISTLVALLTNAVVEDWTTGLIASAYASTSRPPTRPETFRVAGKESLARAGFGA